MTPAILIHGPTASGKTALAIEVARRLGGEVINADSMQVYRDLQVISARPTEEEMDGVKHHLFGHVNGWKRSARPFARLNCAASALSWSAAPAFTCSQ